MTLQNKIYADLDRLVEALAQARAQGSTIVWTNGCFDILHAGHVTYLDEASRLGDLLVVGMNDDSSVREIKGEGRPINSESDRAVVLAALSSVDYVFIFGDRDTIPMLHRLRPEIYVKGGDYTLDTINQEERKLMESIGGAIKIVSGLDGRSTSDLLRRIQR